MIVNGYKIEPGTNLRYADLQYADLRRAKLRGANLQYADLRSAKLRGANLQYADLRGANLQDANLRGADLDFSCWPLWCGSFGVKLDDDQIGQLAYHLLKVMDEKKFKMVFRYLRPIANKAAFVKRNGLSKI